MKKETLSAQMSVISETFNRSVNLPVAWAILKDYEDEAFVEAVIWMVTERTTLYPNDNIIGILVAYMGELPDRRFKLTMENIKKERLLEEKANGNQKRIT